MVLEGVVTNVAAFGAFVDVGVHQDGLVHVSAMSRTFVKDPREVVKSGDVVKVRVLDVDVPRKRISLTLRLDDEPAASGGGRTNQEGRGGPAQRAPQGGRGGQGGRRRAGWSWRQGGPVGGGRWRAGRSWRAGRHGRAGRSWRESAGRVAARRAVAAGSSGRARQRRPMTRWRKPCAAPDWPDLASQREEAAGMPRNDWPSRRSYAAAPVLRRPVELASTRRRKALCGGPGPGQLDGRPPARPQATCRGRRGPRRRGGRGNPLAWPRDSG